MVDIAVRLLGPVRLVVGGEPRSPGGAMARGLCALLACSVNHVVPVDTLLSRLWADEPPRTALNTLQTYVSSLRRAGHPGLVERVGDGYRMVLDPQAVDLCRFEALVHCARASDLAARVALLTTALSLCGGPPLVDAGGAELGGLRQRLLEGVADARERLAEVRLGLADPTHVLAELRELVDDDPLRERRWQLLAVALYRSGRQVEALRELRRARRVLRDRAGLQPTDDFEALERRLLTQDPTLRPDSSRHGLRVAGGADPAAAVAPANDQPSKRLPVPLSSFVGRATDLHAVTDALTRARLVTLTGPGGVGKTRLAVEAVRIVTGDRPAARVHVVELAPAREPGAVPYQILNALPIVPDPSRSPLDLAAAAIGFDPAVVVVDNCEHVLGAVAGALEYLFGCCPRLVVLCTSRESLGVVGEWVHRLEPLDAVDAVRLFEDRAAAAGARRGGVPDQHAVGEICDRLDRIPLAIELAAARTRSMTVHDLAARLGRRFEVLQAPKAADPRHRGLREAIAWSYDLLTEPEQRLFTRMAVFAGPFGLEAASEVCGFPPLDTREVPAILDRLVDKSLLGADLSGKHTAYRMLETVRELALEQLGADIDALEDRHGSFHTTWVDDIGTRLVGPGEGDAVEELDRGWADLRAAVTRALEAADLARVAALIGRLGAEQLFRARTEVREWAEAAMAELDRRPAPAADTGAVLAAVASAGAAFAGDRERSVEQLRRAAVAAKGAKVAWGPEAVMVAIAGILAGGKEPASALLDDAERAAAARGDHDQLVLVAQARAMQVTLTGHLDAGDRMAAEAIAAPPTGLGPSYSSLSAFLRIIAAADPPSAFLDRLRWCLERSRSVSNGWLANTQTNFLSTAFAQRGEEREAISLLAQVLRRNAYSRNLHYISATFRRGAVLLGYFGRYVEAATLLATIEDHPAETSTPAVHAQLRALREEMVAALDPEELRRAERRGRALDPDEAIAFGIEALTDAATPGPAPPG